MCPEYGATVAIFPIDNMTLDYLRLTGREPSHIALVEAYARAQGLFRTDDSPDAVYSETMELDLATVEPSLAGPRRPQDRVPLGKAKASFAAALARAQEGREGRLGRRGTAVATETVLDHGSVVIAAITSCTNTSNPSVMIGAGLLAKKAVDRGLQRKPWVKTSLAPGSKVVTDYLNKAGCTHYLDELGFNLVGYGCTTCIGNSGPLPDEIAADVREHGLVVCFGAERQSQLRGTHSAGRARELSGVAAAGRGVCAGRHDEYRPDDASRSARGADGTPVYLKDIWPSEQEIQQAMLHAVTEESFRSAVRQGLRRRRAVARAAGANRRSLRVGRIVDLYSPAAISRKPDDGAGAADRHPSARARSRVLGDSITTDHISPAGAIKADSPAGRYLIEHGVEPQGFQLVWRTPRQSRSDDARHVRQRAAAQPARAGHRRRVTTSIWDAQGGTSDAVRLRRCDPVHEHLRRGDAVSEARRAADRPRRQGIRLGLVARLGREGDDAARREGGHRGELRADSPQQSGEHGRAAARVQGGRVGDDSRA